MNNGRGTATECSYGLEATEGFSGMAHFTKGIIINATIFEFLQVGQRRKLQFAGEKTEVREEKQRRVKALEFQES